MENLISEFVTNCVMAKYNFIGQKRLTGVTEMGFAEHFGQAFL